MRTRALLAGILVAAVAALTPGAAARPTAVAGLVVVDGKRVSLITLSGARLPVPARLRASPRGLSPDAQTIAIVQYGLLSIGPVRGGPLTPLLRGECFAASCPMNADPTFAWSPDGSEIAVGLIPKSGATAVKVFDLSGTLQRTYALAARNGDNLGRAFHSVVSWSPDGTRLLLLRSSLYGPAAAVVLDLATGRSLVVQSFSPCDGPSLSWSPDGKLVAITTSTTQDCEPIFEVVTAATGGTVFGRDYRGAVRGGTSWVGSAAWAPDSRHLYVSLLTFGVNKVSSRIDVVTVGGVQRTLIGATAGWLTPYVVLPDGLVYTRTARGPSTVLALRAASTGRSRTLLSTRASIDAVVPLETLP
jgi:dipeptidyl aminopeptidase/acylaminoacyl peptidase